MKTRHLLAVVLTFAMLTLATPLQASTWPLSWASDDQNAQTEKFSKTVPLGKTGAVDLTNISGDIVVTGGAGDQVVIEAVKRARTAEALKNAQIEVVASAGRVEILTKYDQSRRHNDGPSVSYTLSIPRGASLRVKSVSGDIQVTTVDGLLRTESVSGDVRLTTAANVEAAKSVSGDIVVKGSGATDAADLESVSGDLDVTGFKARVVEASTVSGDLTLTDLTCERMTGKTVSGEVAFSGPLAKAGRYALQSHSGDVTMAITNGAGFEVSANTFSGDIRSDFELTVRFGGETDRRGRRQEIRGTYGDGSATLELKTFSGSVQITKGGAPKK